MLQRKRFSPKNFSSYFLCVLAQKLEIKVCHQTLVKALGKPERRVVLQIIDAKDYIIENIFIDSFFSGFELAWKLSVELNNYEKRAPSLLPQDERIGGSFPIHEGGRKMKKLIMATVVAICLVLYVAVWPQGEVVEEIPEPTQEIAVNTPEHPLWPPKRKPKSCRGQRKKIPSPAVGAAYGNHS